MCLLLRSLGLSFVKVSALNEFRGFECTHSKPLMQINLFISWFKSRRNVPLIIQPHPNSNAE